MRFVLFCALLFAASASLFAQAPLRSGDTIEIRLSGVPAEEMQQFSAPISLDDQGMLNLPYIGQVKAAGMLPNEVQNSIERKLVSEKIYTRPTITIIVQAASRFVSVSGSVRNPGRIPFQADLTLMSAISAAGGLNDFADLKRVRLVHDKKVEVIDARRIRKDPALDIKIFPGDQVDVPQSAF